MCVTILDSYDRFMKEVILFIPEESEAQKEKIIGLKLHSCPGGIAGFST